MILPTTPGGFAVIEADPPWSFATYDGESSVPTQAADPYRTMSLDALKALPVADVTAPDCLLHLWTFGCFLEQALALGAAWGFTYKTDGFMWVKQWGDAAQIEMFDHPPRTKIGMGYWNRKEVEYGLIFTRGSPSRISGGVRQVIFAQAREHSRKPDERYERLEALAPGPYLELFGRRSRRGWTIFGDEATKFD